MAKSEEATLSLTAKVAMWSSHHRRLVGLTWLAIVVASVGAMTLVPVKTAWENSGRGDSGTALKLYEERFGSPQLPSQELAVFSSTLKVDDPAYKENVESLMTRLSELRETKSREVAGTKVTESKRVVSGTVTHYDMGLPREASPFVAASDNGDVSLALVSLQENDPVIAGEQVPLVTNAVKEADASLADFSIVSGGEISAFAEQDKIIKEDLQLALILNLTVTLAILLIVFRAPVAAVIPLALAFAAVITASAVLAFVSRVYVLSPIYTEMVLLMGLATGIDYALFVISRFRHERNSGKSKEEALRTAAGTSGKAVVFAGCTVLLAISGMFLVGDPTFTSLGLAAVIVVALAVLISVTLLPALLSALANHLDRFGLPFLGAGEERGSIWGYITDHVLKRPAVLATLVTAGLIALAFPLTMLNLGFNGAKSLPEDIQAKKALLALEENFTLGLTSPAEIMVDAGQNNNIYAADAQARITKLIDAIEAQTVSPEQPDAPFGSPIQTEVNDAGDTEVIRVPLNADTGEQKALDAVKSLRSDIIPGAFDGSPARVLVFGMTAGNIDFHNHISSRTPIVFIFVLSLAFFILLLTFRSLVIAVKAIILNLLSVGAAYGLLVLVFQKGWLFEKALNFQSTGIIEMWLPLFLFAILFGLSMDYHMFVLARIKESWEHGEHSDRAVSLGIRATAGTITSAAVIMVAVALIFALTRNIGMKQFGFGLATAILIDATVIRSILLPATMKLLGDYNWYLPRWLAWLPRIKMSE